MTYQQRIEKFEADFKEKEAITNKISMLRIVTFLLLVVAIIQYISSNFEQSIWLFVFLTTIPVFAYLVKWHQRVFDQKSLLEQLLLINKKEQRLQQENVSEFEGGAAYADPMHDYAADLDLFGEASLFSVVNRTSTARGEQHLANLFKQSLPDVAAIEQQQIAVKELAPKLDFRQNFMAKGYLTEDTLEDLTYLQTWASSPPVFRTSTFWKTVRILLPAITLATLVFYMFTFQYLPLLLMVIVNLGFLGVQAKYIGQEHTFIGKKQGILKMYISLLHLARQETFEQSSILQQIHKDAVAAEESFNKLVKIINYFDQRQNVLVGLGLNLLVLYDLQCLFALEKWKADYHQELEKWLLDVAQMDTLLSLGGFYYNNPDFTFPHLTISGNNKIVAKALGHPLIPAQQRINNDCSLGADGKSIFVVTGSNMAGKSTFLRAVAVNLLLAKIGAPVCAEQLEANLMDIITSMRVQDSVSKNTSYFQAELQRMQYIVQTLDKKKPTFVILDEILKGTNSDDKLLGSQLLVKRFLDLNCISMIATHDLDLGKMEETYPQKIENLCFESKIEDEVLSFDYKLNKGIAKNKNATFLMYQMEIVEKEV